MTENLLNKRTAIVVLKGTEPAAVANASAIIMGQLSRINDEVYSADPPEDLGGLMHAGIRYNVVVLSGRRAQIDRLVKLEESSGVNIVVFGSEGRALSNSYEEYEKLISVSFSDELNIFAVGVCGDHEEVRSITKGLSVYK